MKFLKKLFTKDKVLLVARLTVNMRWRWPVMGIYAWQDVPVTFHCYESKKGKRKFNASCTKTSIDASTMDIYSDLNGWKKHAHNLLHIPSFDAVNSGVPILCEVI